MLPSMPLLMTPVKELTEDSSDSSDESPSPNHMTGNCHSYGNNVSESASEIDGSRKSVQSNGCVESTEGVLLHAGTDKAGGGKSPTPEKRVLPEPTSAQKKKKKTQHKKTLAALTPDSWASLEASAQSFAESYFLKVRNQLDDEKWSQFVQELNDFEAKTEKKPVELYRRMEELLSPHSQLIDEFLGFLLPEQALEVNRFMPYLVLVKMKEFFRKLNILLMKRQVHQVYSALESLTVKPNVSLSDVKTAILPLLKASPILTNQFLELLPGERPPDSLMVDFEKVDIKDDSEFETIIVPDCPDPYGNENCICSCHSHQTRHCITCGIKYLNGRVYLQYGKSLRPAKVMFKGHQHQDLHKWGDDKCRARRRFLPKTMFSPSGLDHRTNVDSEDDSGVKKSPRTPRIRATRSKTCKKGKLSQEEEVLEGIFPLVDAKSSSVTNNNETDMVVDCEEKHDKNEEHEFDEVVLENDCNTEEEEEFLNKELHSENDSSLEAEDINKAMESGNDCSFEDEEVEDMESSEVEQIEMFKENSTNEKATSSPEFPKDVIDNKNENNLKKDQTEKKSHVEDSVSSSYDKNDSNPPDQPKNELKAEDLVSKRSIIEENICENEATIKATPVGTPEGMDIDCHIKTENEKDISDICDSQSAVVKQECKEEDHKLDEEESTKIATVDNTTREWTREEDKIILQTFQHENGLEQTFETASLQLPNRSKEEIQERFEVLLKLLKEMISDESNSNP